MARAVAALGLLTMLAACDGEDPVNSALRDTAAANHAAATRTTAQIEAASPAPAADTDSADKAWVAATLVDHQRTLAAAEVQLTRTQDPEVRRVVEALIATRRREIAELQALQTGSVARAVTTVMFPG